MAWFAPMTPRTARIALSGLLLGIYSTLYVARTVSNLLRDAGLLRAAVATAFVLAGVSVIVFLMRHPSLRTPRTVLATLGVAVVYAAVIFPMSSPEEKLHFLEYGAVGVLAFFSARPEWSTTRRFLFAVLLTLAAGWLDEGIQALLPNRHYDLRDVGFNALAGTMALTAFGFIRWSAKTPQLAVVLAALMLPQPAQAMLKWVYDVPGLALKAEAIVVAEHVDAGRYRIKESLRGTLAAGVELAVPDDDYVTTWDAGEREVVLFLEMEQQRWVPVSSGLRQRRDGQMHRFEQTRNPGSFEAVPEGRDLEAFLDELRAVLAAQPRLEELGKEPELTKRRAAAKALLPAAIPAEQHSFAFIDERARRVLTVLMAGGDLGGALELLPRDRSTAPLSQQLATLEQLLSFAEDSTRLPKLRARALSAADSTRELPRETKLVARLRPLLGDSSALVRAQAALLLGRTRDWSSSDAQEQRSLKVNAVTAKAALRGRFAVEQDLRVLDAILRAGERSPRKRAPHLAAGLSERGAGLTLSVTCLGQHVTKGVKLFANQQLVIQSNCGSATTAQPLLKPGVYELSLQEQLTTRWSMGQLVVSDEGAWELE